ncbi:fasciclin domain-containing protein [Streptomyces nitrosporeus]|uniref:Fasciclin domain-containing protein n=1 Tax=Streptomyces nitrosporeus TaxID=28894 RepID=A0A5J6FHR5_9ACTN|nr:fasciclin domain-containing protein [Streptomyces nitrosporeus]QEU75357.1 fasciclin domain-containing protein [Streptomyces nitrosporeus]GGZ02678.1 lipoprotein [Streptomyces nitrosporeus]
MNNRAFRRVALAVSAAAVLPLVLTACSGDGDTSASGSGASAAKSSSAAPAEETKPLNEPFGPACSTVPQDGAGSFAGMAQDPVATAASNNPALSTLVAAVKQAGLVDTLNNAENLTVFAPTNDAFAKIPKADLDKLLADKEQLTTVLTSHVVGQRLAPAQLEKGSFDTLAKTKLTTAGSGTDYTVNDSSKVVCGNVQTSNATVYIIDTVLMPMS